MSYPNLRFDLIKDLMEGDELFLNRLPIVAMREVVQYLTISERIKLAMTSKKMKRNLSYCKIPKAKCVIKICDEYSNIYFENEKLNLHCGRKSYRYSESETLDKNKLKPWLQKNQTVLENIVELFGKISELVNFTSVTLDFNLKLMEMISVQQVLSVPELNIWECAQVNGREMEKEEMDSIMEKANESRSIAVRYSLPKGYNHRNMFKFHDLTYCDASWLKVSHILSLRNKTNLLFTNTSLNFDDVNTLVKRWIDSDYDIFKRLYLIQQFPTPLENPINSSFKDCVVMETYRGQRTSFFLTCANPKKVERKRTVLCFFKYQKGISLETYSPEEPVEHKSLTFTPFTKEFEILKMLNEMKQMEDEMKSIESILSTDIDENEKKELIEKRIKLKLQLEIKKAEIEEENVQFVDGRWKINEN